MAPRSLKLDLLTKRECHLCEEMKTLLEKVRGDYDLAIAEVDIEGDPALFERYREEIPVLLIEGRKAFKVRATERALRRRLDRALLVRRLFGG